MELNELQAKLKEVEALAAEIRGRLAGATNAEKIAALVAAQPMIKPGTKAMDALLQTGYGMSVTDAEKIIKERDANPMAWPLEEYRKAQALLAAFKAKPKPTARRKGWKREIR